jgi:glutathione S-transferase
MTSATIVLHGTALSGHVHRVELLLRMLGLPYRFEESPLEVRRTPAFRALNPLGQIPVLQDGEVVLADSNAILVYLARRYGAGTGWLPEEPVAAAQVQRWLSIAAGELRHGPAQARMVTLWGRPGDPVAARAIAGDLLRFMDGHLAARRFLAGEQPTIADLACCGYVARAPEGRVSLEPYPAVRAWLERVEALPGFQPIPRSVVPPEVSGGEP